MASPVSGLPIGRTQSPQPTRGRGFTTILCDGTFRPGPSSLGSPLALVRSRSVRAVTSWREPRLILTASSQAGGSSQQHASAKKVNLNRLQQQQQCCVSSTLQSGVSWRRPSGSFACHGPTIPLAIHPVHLTRIHSELTQCIFHNHGYLVVFAVSCSSWTSNLIITSLTSFMLLFMRYLINMDMNDSQNS